MRTRNLLSLDLPSIVWKQLAGVELDDDDLRETDYSCWSTLQFRDQDGQVRVVRLTCADAFKVFWPGLGMFG